MAAYSPTRQRSALAGLSGDGDWLCFLDDDAIGVVLNDAVEVAGLHVVLDGAWNQPWAP